MDKKVVDFPSSSGGGGDMIEYRLSKLEKQVDDVHMDIKGMDNEMRKEMAAIRETIARMEGKLDRTPTAMQIWPMIVTTWIAGAGIVALAARVVTT